MGKAQKMKFIKIYLISGLIIVAILTILALVVAPSLSVGVGGPGVPTMDNENCSRSTGLCIFTITNPISDSITITRGILTNGSATISSTAPSAKLLANSLTNVTMSLPNWIGVNSTLGYQFLFSNGDMLTGTISVT